MNLSCSRPVKAGLLVGLWRHSWIRRDQTTAPAVESFSVQECQLAELQRNCVGFALLHTRPDSVHALLRIWQPGENILSLAETPAQALNTKQSRLGWLSGIN